MARPREFDSDATIEQAMRLFWTKGYKNTGLRDLLKAMKIGEGSFYNLYRGKKELYLRCLDRYNDLVTKPRLAILDSTPSVKVAIRKFFDVVIEESSDPGNPPACLMANSLFADVLVDPDLRATVEREFRAFEQYLAGRLTRAVKAGELPKGFPIQSTAGILITFLQGFFRMYGSLHDKRAVKRQIDQLLADLNLGASPTRLNVGARPTSPASRRASTRSRALPAI
jgi:TetR/AcrR family transcriptional repressor of nem operon